MQHGCCIYFGKLPIISLFRTLLAAGFGAYHRKRGRLRKETDLEGAELLIIWK